MDPFDDYDPQQYEYDDESDQEDDIVYVEGPMQGEDPFLPYLAKDVEFSQSQQTQSTQQQQVAVPNLLPRRERQRRRTEQAAAQMMEESSDSELSHDPADNEEQDTFASLQSLLDKQSQQEKEKAALKANETETSRMDAGSATAAETSSGVDTGPVEQAAPAQDVHDSFTGESQSQFPLADDDDWESTPVNHPQTESDVPLVSNTAEYNIMSSMDGPSISLGLAKELQRHRKQNHAQPMTSVDPPSAVDSNLLSELEKNRKRAQKKTASRSNKRSVGGSDRSQFRRKSSCAPVTSSKSIVGSRPQHWGAARTPALPVAKARKHAVSPKSSHLAAAVKTRPRSSSLSNPTKSSFLKNSTSGRDEAPNRISFAPHFFHTKKSSTDAVDEVESTQRSEHRVTYQTPRILQRFNQNSHAAYSAGSSNGSDSAKRKRKQTSSKKLKAGPLMKRLRALRSAVDGDTIRFQSGMYPFAHSVSRRFDLSDPRNRATSFMDVSIVCEPVPWDEHERITVLGFIHNSEKVSNKSANDIGNLVEGGRFAWLSFTYDTAREQNVREGSQLRIYNTVSIPSSSAIQINGYGDDAVVADRCCDQTIVCTQLCEPYPDSLPKLPDVIARNNSNRNI